MSRSILIILLWGIAYAAKSQVNTGISIDNKFSPISYSRFAWKVFIVANPEILNSINQVEYYWDPSYATTGRIVKTDPRNPKFTLCSSGSGEFVLRIKIIFKSDYRPPMYLTYPLDLHTFEKRDSNYECNFESEPIP